MSIRLKRMSPGKEALVQAVSGVCGTLAVHFLAVPGSLLCMYCKDFKPVTEERLAPFHFTFKGNLTWARGTALVECLPSI